MTDTLLGPLQMSLSATSPAGGWPAAADDEAEDGAAAGGGHGGLAGAVRCRCGAEVLQVLREAGRPLLLDPRPHPEGVVQPVRVAGRLVGRVLSRAEVEVFTGQLWRPHAPRCRVAMGASVMVAAPGRLPLSASACRVCAGLMAVALLEIGEDSHPTC